MGISMHPIPLLFPLVLLSATATATAQQQVDIWACQGTSSAGFTWNGNEWTTASFHPNNYIVKLAESESTYSFDGNTRTISCTAMYKDEVVCSNPATADMLALNTKTGMGSRSSIFGALETTATRDSISLDALQCVRM